MLDTKPVWAPVSESLLYAINNSTPCGGIIWMVALKYEALSIISLLVIFVTDQRRFDVAFCWKSVNVGNVLFTVPAASLHPGKHIAG